MKTRLYIAGAVLVSLLILPFVLAEEDGKPSPAENFRRLTATFPKPAKGEAFSFEGYFFMRGENLGTVRLSAEPVEKDGSGYFRVEDRLELVIRRMEVVLTNRALLDSRLSGVSGEQVREQPQGATRAAWTKGEGGGVAIEMTVPGHEVPGTILEVDGEVLTSMSAILLFCRQATVIGEEYAFTILDANPPPPKGHLEVMKMRVEGPGPWRDGKAFLYSGRRKTQTMTIALEEGTRMLLGIRIAEENGTVAEVRMGALGPKPAAEAPPPPPVVPNDPVVSTLTDPAATGLAVTLVVDGSQAKELGVLPGDVLVNYDGKETPTMEALRQAMGAAGEKESVVLTFVRGPQVLAINFKPGPMGLDLTPVVKGESVTPLPPATPLAFDFSPLREGPHDTWHAFLLGDKKAGFEHGVVRMEDGKLIVRREVAFDGGEQWGLNHFVVDIEATAERIPLLLKSRFENPVSGWIGTGEMDAVGDGRYRWNFHWEVEGDSGDRDIPVAKNTIPEYLVEILALYMPKEKGACWHFRPVGEGVGDLLLPAALLCAGQVDLVHDGETVKAWLYEQHQLGGMVPGKYWVSEDHRMLFVDYGGAQGRLTTKEEALKGLHNGIVPRTAD